MGRRSLWGVLGRPCATRMLFRYIGLAASTTPRIGNAFLFHRAPIRFSSEGPISPNPETVKAMPALW